MSRSSEPLSQDVIFDILSNARRRYVLYFLKKSGEPIELSELAEELAAWENETTVEDLTTQQRKRVYVSLYQTHIQKLSEAGLVEYDPDSGLVSLSDETDQIDAYLSLDGETEWEPSWENYYIALAVMSGILYTLVAFDVFIFSLVSELVIGLGIALSFIVLSAIHLYYTRMN